MLSSNLCRCTGYENIVKAVRAAAAEMRAARAMTGPRNRHVDRPIGRRGWRTRRWCTGPRPLRRRHLAFRTSCTCAWCARNHAHGRIARDRYRGGAARCPAWSRSGPAPTSRICRRSISARAASRSSIPTASRCWRPDRVRYVGEPVAAVFADDPYRGRGRGRSRHHRDRGTAGRARRRRRRRASSRPAATTEPTIIRQGYGDVDAAFARAPHAVVELELDDRPPLRRAAGDARRDRAATTRRATCSSCTAPPRCRTATATLLARMLGRGAVGHSCCTRATSAAASASAASSIPRTCWSALAAMRLGRPVKWIEDRREHLIAANHSRQQRHRIRAAVDARGPHPRASTTSSFTTRAPMCAPTAPASCDMTAGMLPGPYRIPAYRVGRPFPPDQQDAGGDLSRARPLRDARSCASG